MIRARIGINMLLWSDDPLDLALLPCYRRLAELGFDGVELPIFSGDPRRYQALGTLLDDLGLARTVTTALGAHQDPTSNDPEMRAAALEHLRLVVDCSAAVGALLVGGPLYAALGHFTGHGPCARTLDNSAAVVAATADHAADAGIVLALEFLNRFETYVLNTAADTCAFVQRVDRPNVTVHYDSFHAHIEERNVAATIAACGAAIGHVHISESDRGVPGTGQVHWDATFRALSDIDYQGWLTIESFGQSLPALAAATKIWRPLFADPFDVAEGGLALIRAGIKKSCS